MKNLKKYLANLSLVIFGIFMALALVEVIFTYVYPQSDDFYQFDPYIGWKHIPNKTGLWVRKEFVVPIKINSEGFRDVEHFPEKPPDVYRIVVLGDSFVEAFQVKYEETFCYLLEKMLNSDSEIKKKVEVINLGVSAFGTAQEYQTLRYYGLKYNPDLVILLFCTNDVTDNVDEDIRRPRFALDSKGNLIQVWKPKCKTTAYESIKNFFKGIFPKTYNFVANTLGSNPTIFNFLVKMGIARPSPKNETKTRNVNPYEVGLRVFSVNYSEDFRHAWNLTKALILATKKEAEENNAKFLFVLPAVKWQVHEDYFQELLNKYTFLKKNKYDLERPNKILINFSIENDIKYVDLLPYFKNYVNKTGLRLFYYYDGHWNANGHKLAAQVLYEKVRDIILKSF